MNSHSFRRWTVAFATTVFLVILSIAFLDHPISRFMARFGISHVLSTSETIEQPWMVFAACAAVIIGALHLLLRRPLPRWAKAGLLGGTALLISVSIVAFILKPLFSRTMPPELLANGLDKFFWPSAADSGYSFPSGHSTQAAAILSVLWAYYPQWRWLYISAFLILAVLLTLGEWHYLSDIIAGGFIGWNVGIAVMRTWRRFVQSTHN